MKFSDHFTIKELACPCCGVIKLAPGFIEALESLRVLYDHPMTVNSCCRCKSHNDSKEVGGHPRSLHMFDNQVQECDTNAIDIRRPNAFMLNKFLGIALNKDLNLGFSVGLADTFVHLDKRTEYTKLNLEPVFYTY